MSWYLYHIYTGEAAGFNAVVRETSCEADSGSALQDLSSTVNGGHYEEVSGIAEMKTGSLAQRFCRWEFEAVAERIAGQAMGWNAREAATTEKGTNNVQG